LLDEFPVHNEALAGDTLYSIQLNYRWRELLAAAMTHYFLSDRSELSLDNQDLLDDFLIDLYDAELIGSLMNIKPINVDLAANQTTTSTSFVALTNSGFAFTPTKPNVRIAVHNLHLANSGGGQVQARIKFNAVYGNIETIALNLGTGQRPFMFSSLFTSVPIGAALSGQIDWKVSSGTGTAFGNNWLVIEVIEYD